MTNGPLWPTNQNEHRLATPTEWPSTVLNWTCARGNCARTGRKIRLQAQPFQLLALLIENAGEVVTRDEVCRALWQADTFVDFDHSVSAAVNKIREALSDSVENPRFIETLPKRGYRFIGKIKPEAPVVMSVAKVQQSVELVPAPSAKA